MKNKIKQLEEELLEQCVLNGKGSEREAALLAKVERLERENAALRKAKEMLEAANRYWREASRGSRGVRNSTRRHRRRTKEAQP